MNQMRPLFIFLCLFLLVKGLAQEKYTVYQKDFNPTAIVAAYFEAKYNPATKEFQWKPNFAEQQDFGVSADGFLYTEIDTVFTFSIHNSRIIIATATYEKDEKGERLSDHPSAPSLSLLTFELNTIAGTYELVNAKKFVTRFGNSGHADQLALVVLTDEIYFVEVTGGYTSVGYTIEYISLYHNGEELLTLEESGNDNSGFTDDPKEQFNYGTDLKVNKSKKQVIFIKKGTNRDDKTGKIIDVNTTATYQFDEDTGRLEKITSK